LCFISFELLGIVLPLLLGYFLLFRPLQNVMF
jgi:hypothetical protein